MLLVNKLTDGTEFLVPQHRHSEPTLIVGINLKVQVSHVLRIVHSIWDCARAFLRRREFPSYVTWLLINLSSSSPRLWHRHSPSFIQHEIIDHRDTNQVLQTLEFTNNQGPVSLFLLQVSKIVLLAHRAFFAYPGACERYIEMISIANSKKRYCYPNSSLGNSWKKKNTYGSGANLALGSSLIQSRNTDCWRLNSPSLEAQLRMGACCSLLVVEDIARRSRKTLVVGGGAGLTRALEAKRKIIEQNMDWFVIADCCNKRPAAGFVLLCCMKNRPRWVHLWWWQSSKNPVYLPTKY